MSPVMPRGASPWPAQASAGPGRADARAGRGRQSIKMEAFLQRLKFPEEGMLQDVLAKLTAESVWVEQLLSVEQSEFEDIGISGEALAIILAGAEVEKQQVR
jgi:hypothetical protein